ncbi:MAG TPA: poly-beta-1,6-N-acetyl-D-glucosamine N-deacetylase PgaB [Woeseiaceae bacterium]
MIRILLLAMLVLAGPFAQAKPVHVLAYHDVLERGNPQLDRDDMAVSTNHLIQHFRWLRDNGFTPVSIDQLEAAAAGRGELPEKPVLLTFDDGLQSVYTHVYPLLQLFKYPAVVSLVTAWIDGDIEVDYAGKERQLQDFLTWEQIREMQGSGLVEFASHSHDLHKGIAANPQGNTQPSAIALKYEDGAYESLDEHVARIRADLEQSAGIMEAQLGVRPRVITWPYGAFNEVVKEVAADLGMTWSLTLEPNGGSDSGSRQIDRHLIQENPGIRQLSAALLGPAPVPLLRAAQVDLDFVYDEDPVQQQKNLDMLVERVYRLGLSHVFLQAYSDTDGDGYADSMYFPNRVLPMRADLFNHTAWQLKTRALVTVYAWMPVTSFNTPAGDVADSNEPDPRTLVKNLYQDLATYNRFDGIHFQDELPLNTVALDGLRAHVGHSTSGKPPIKNTGHLFRESNSLRFVETLAFTDELTAVVSRYQQGLKTSRNLFAPAFADSAAANSLVQDFGRYFDHYDFVSVMAMPDEEGSDKSNDDLYRQLVAQAASRPGMLLRTLFQLQTVDWHSGERVSAAELRDTMRKLQALGVKHLGYYPDDFLRNQPDQGYLRQGISIAEYTPEMQP